MGEQQVLLTGPWSSQPEHCQPPLPALSLSRCLSTPYSNCFSGMKAAHPLTTPRRCPLEEPCLQHPFESAESTESGYPGLRTVP